MRNRLAIVPILFATACGVIVGLKDRLPYDDDAGEMEASFDATPDASGSDAPPDNFVVVATCEVSSDCNDNDPCTHNICLSAQCTYPGKDNGDICDDGTFCKVGKTCQSGKCQGGTDRCPTSNPTTTCSEQQKACLCSAGSPSSCKPGVYDFMSKTCSWSDNNGLGTPTKCPAGMQGEELVCCSGTCTYHNTHDNCGTCGNNCGAMTCCNGTNCC